MMPAGARPDPDPWPPSRPARRRRDIALVLVIAVSAVTILVLAAGLLLPWLASIHPGPSDFAPAGIERVSPGSIGCRSTSGSVCYAAVFESSLQGLTLAHLRFVVANASAGENTNGPLAPSLPLGVNAVVTALASPTSIAGVWNVSEGQWTSGGDWPVPVGPNVTVILDTGLASNATLSDAELGIVLTSPYQGSLGFPLYCAGC